MSSTRTCIECTQWNFDTGCSDYSDVTPGESWSMWCQKDHYHIGGLITDQEDLRDALRTAENCKDFESREG